MTLIAAALRLVALDLAPFAYDEADAILRARAFAQGQPAVAGAMTSWGIQDPPLQVYLMSLMAALPRPPLAAAAAMAVLNSLAVLGTYVLVTRFFGSRVALLAALFYALNPWAIYFSRRSWIQLQPALTVVALWASLEVVVVRRTWLAVPFWLALAANVQMRLLALTYGPAALVCLVVGGGLWRTRWTLVGLCLGLLVSLPYAVYVVTRWAEIEVALGAGNRGVGTRSPGRALELAWWTASGLNLLTTPESSPVLDLLGRLLWLVCGMVALLLVAGLLYSMTRCLTGASDWRQHLLLLGWTLLPLGVVAAQSSTVYLHYYVFLMPQLFIVLSLGCEALFRLLGRRWRAGLVVPSLVLGTFVCVWVGLQLVLSWYTLVETRETPAGERRLVAELARTANQAIATGESYGVETPMRFWLATADLTRALLGSDPGELLVVTQGTNPLAEARPAQFEAVLGPDLMPRYLRSDTVALPIGRPALLVWSGDTELPVHPDRLGPRRALLPLPSQSRTARDGMRFYALPARSAGELAEAAGLPSPMALDGSGVVVHHALPARLRAGDQAGIPLLYSGSGDLEQASLIVIDAAGTAFAERTDGSRMVIRPQLDTAMLVEHVVPLPSRARPGSGRLVLEGYINGRAVRAELGPVTIQPAQ